MNEGFRAEGLLLMMKRISLDLSAQMEQRLKCKNMTGVQVYFLVYILRHHPEGTYLTELCREVGVSKATLSALIKKMREKDYLYFLEEPGDIRRKKVLPTAKLIAEGSGFLQKADCMEAEICSVLDEEEQRKLWDLEKKLIGQFAAMEESEKDRQEVYNREKSITAVEAV
ncbi:MAG TPA: MarR family transcriptional regulator [Candidatus Mediterraneibacter quadrami]|uniref:MarR family transcriptional regulator n=1 Tax=Candidatus Mediterraneibacter quadrami TaxID=2838684 RepID=A0A9D2RBK0_9FIRM|nr:MarR family transcriptional regulator [Candidatus Mediterraneibacter quadrami]